MSRHIRHLLLGLTALAAGTALAVAVPQSAPGEAAPSTASFTAVDYSWNVSGGSAHAVTIAEGGTVTFGYPSGGSEHNVDFGGAAGPTSCTQTAGGNSGAVPPLPRVPTAPGWSGNCRFDTPGTFAFHCDLHTGMQGTITVVDPNAPPPPGVTPPGSGNPPPAPGGSSGTSGRPHATAAHRQMGKVVRGSVTTLAGTSRIAVTALASNRALSAHRPKHVRKVSVGSRSLRATGAGTTPFALTLNAAARSALQRRGSLAISLRVVIAPAGARPVTTTIAIAMRKRAAPAPPSGSYYY